MNSALPFRWSDRVSSSRTLLGTYRWGQRLMRKSVLFVTFSGTIL